MFLAVVMDETHNHDVAEQKMFEYKAMTSAERMGSKPYDGRDEESARPAAFIEKNFQMNFTKISETSEEAVFVKDCVVLEDEIMMSIIKKKSAFAIILSRPQEMDDAASQELKEAAQSKGDGSSPLATEEFGKNALLIRVQPFNGNSQFAKIIRC